MKMRDPNAALRLFDAALRLDPGNAAAARGKTTAAAAAGAANAERAAQTLGPLFSKVRRGLEKLTRECVTLEVALERNTEPHIMALLLPDYWADFIRSGPIEDVKPLGVGGQKP